MVKYWVKALYQFEANAPGIDLRPWYQSYEGWSPEIIHELIKQATADPFVHAYRISLRAAYTEGEPVPEWRQIHEVFMPWKRGR